VECAPRAGGVPEASTLPLPCLGNWRQLQDTTDYLEVLSLDIGIPIASLLQRIQGRGNVSPLMPAPPTALWADPGPAWWAELAAIMDAGPPEYKAAILAYLAGASPEAAMEAGALAASPACEGGAAVHQSLARFLAFGV